MFCEIKLKKFAFILILLEYLIQLLTFFAQFYNFKLYLKTKALYFGRIS